MQNDCEAPVNLEKDNVINKRKINLYNTRKVTV